MAEHTPGPWKSEITEEGRAVIDLGEDHQTWFRWLCPSRGDMETFEGVDLATLDLAAAAPELLEILEEWLSLWGTEEGYRGPTMVFKPKPGQLLPLVMKTEQVVKKAKGELLESQ